MRCPLLLTLFIFCTSFVYSNSFKARVVKIIDGNTLEVLDQQENETYRVMVAGVDAPELEQEYGVEARDYLESRTLGKKVNVELIGKDRKGNKQAVIKLKNGQFLGAMLVEAGYAWKKPNSEIREMLVQEAQANKNGLWKDENPTPPWVYERKQSMKKPKTGLN